MNDDIGIKELIRSAISEQRIQVKFSDGKKYSEAIEVSVLPPVGSRVNVRLCNSWDDDDRYVVIGYSFIYLYEEESITVMIKPIKE